MEQGHAPYIAIQMAMKDSKLSKKMVGDIFYQYVPKEDYDVNDRDELLTFLTSKYAI